MVASMSAAAQRRAELSSSRVEMTNCRVADAGPVRRATEIGEPVLNESGLAESARTFTGSPGGGEHEDQRSVAREDAPHTMITKDGRSMPRHEGRGCAVSPPRPNATTLASRRLRDARGRWSTGLSGHVMNMATDCCLRRRERSCTEPSAAILRGARISQQFAPTDHRTAEHRQLVPSRFGTRPKPGGGRVAVDRSRRSCPARSAPVGRVVWTIIVGCAFCSLSSLATTVSPDGSTLRLWHRAVGTNHLIALAVPSWMF